MVRKSKVNAGIFYETRPPNKETMQPSRTRSCLSCAYYFSTCVLCFQIIKRIDVEYERGNGPYDFLQC